MNFEPQNQTNRTLSLYRKVCGEIEPPQNRIDHDLNIIRQHGRQYFLDTQPAGFSRVVHDYSEGRKGFVVWKDLVEERLG